jgi:hypothetical protein
MTRMIVSLEEKDKSWLDRQAVKAGLSRAEIVRQAVRRMQHDEEETFDQLLDATRGIWRGGDGLRYQRKARREWDERPAGLGHSH